MFIGFKIFEKGKSEKGKLNLILSTENTENSDSEVGVWVCDDEGVLLERICVFEETGHLCLCDELDEDMGLKLNPAGEIITY